MLTLDLLDVNHLDCAGIGAIMAVYNSATKANPEQPIQVLAIGEAARMLEVNGLSNVLRLGVIQTTRSFSDPDIGENTTTSRAARGFNS